MTLDGHQCLFEFLENFGHIYLRWSGTLSENEPVVVSACHIRHQRKGDEMNCPHCGSSQVTARNWGRRVGGGLGGVAGAFTGSATALSGAEIGSCIGTVGGPLGMVAGGIGGVLLRALVGAGLGCAVGAEAGETFDGTLLHRFACEACGYKFNQ